MIEEKRTEIGSARIVFENEIPAGREGSIAKVYFIVSRFPATYRLEGRRIKAFKEVFKD